MYSGRRPIIPLQFADSPRRAREIIYGLVDTGAQGNRAPAAWGRSLGLDLSEGKVETFIAGGKRCVGNVHRVRLKVGKCAWEAPVTFSDDWNESFMLLGMVGFFDRFVVKIDSRDNHTVLTPIKVP